eukprot:gene6107-4390_t
MAGVLTLNLVYQKARNDDVDRIRKLNVCSSSLQDIGVLRHLPNLELLSLSVNDIDEIGALSCCPRLTEVYLRRNQIKDINQILHLSRLRNLQVANFADNPICRDPNYRRFVIAALPSLRQLDDTTVTNEERRSALQVFPELSRFAPPSSPYADQRGGIPPPTKVPATPNRAAPQASQKRPPSAGSYQQKRPPSSNSYQDPRRPPSSSGCSVSSIGPSEAGVVQAVKTLCSELSPAGVREIHRYLDSLGH